MLSKFGKVMAVAVAFTGAAMASADVDAPAEQGIMMTSNVEADAGLVGGANAVVKTATASANVQEGLEVPFIEGRGAPRPVAGYAWCLVTKSAEYLDKVTETLVRPETYYTKCVPAEYAVQDCRIMVCPPKKIAYAVPAKVTCKKIKVLVEEAQVSYSIIPAEYKYVEKELDVQPSTTAKVWIPAVYKTVEEKIMVKPPMRKVGEGACVGQKANSEGDPALCVTSEYSPAEYVTITKEVLVKEGELVDSPLAGRKQTVKVKVLSKPAEVKECVIPPKYEEIAVAEVSEGSGVEFKSIPAVYKSIKRLVMVKPETSVQVKVPAKYESRLQKVLASPEIMVWRLVKKDGCDVDIKDNVVKEEKLCDGGNCDNQVAEKELPKAEVVIK
ncbi:hypothetical protein FACS1894139_08550 [Planctomycetales bacterium]|nr:hypothetical protein FACS1894107_05630 [Planctomycetales bacterium]GHS96672.1 hypothetical protein FACS1894108_01690 [Planctomycetales bacterium]GHT05173.1 hypothetical protein FACS1894139_08550 [Planctomycetales bacterium]GHV20712.1 hypothetical protein AGMMS49959_08650 [Planctomycetales bacterium]